MHNTDRRCSQVFIKLVHLCFGMVEANKWNGFKDLKKTLDISRIDDESRLEGGE
jgi:hypothetical protein